MTMVRPRSHPAWARSTHDATATEPLALLRLLHLVSPALPVGAYAYSQGLEYAVHAGWVRDERARSTGSRARLPRPSARSICRCCCGCIAAWSRDDTAAVQRWNAQLIAARETAELRAEERHLGRALARVLVELRASRGVRMAAARHRLRDAVQPGGGALGHRRLATTLSGYLWAWSENQVLAAVKLVPLGQSAGQRLLHRLTDLLPPVVARALELPDEAVGTSALSQVLAASLHESQYSRLFRS